MLDYIIEKSIFLFIMVGSLILIGAAITWLLGKAKVKITTERMLYVLIMGIVLMFIGGDYSLYYLGMFIMTIGVTLFLSHRYITVPSKKKSAEYEEVLLKAKSGLLNEDEARELLKLATKYEAKGQLSEAKYYYELIIKSDTPISADAQSCLNNPLLNNVDTVDFKEKKQLNEKWMKNSANWLTQKKLFGVSLKTLLSIFFVLFIYQVLIKPNFFQTNGDYLKTLIDSGTIEQAAVALINEVKKVESGESKANLDWKQKEAMLRDCTLQEAKKYLASGDPYLSKGANKQTPLILAERFLQACDFGGDLGPFLNSH